MAGAKLNGLCNPHLIFARRFRFGAPGVLLCMAAFLASATIARADYVNLLTPDQSGFENDTVNPDPRVFVGAVPTGWDAANVNPSPNDVSVEAVGSPFDGGSSKSMIIYKSTTGPSNPQLRATVTLPTNTVTDSQFQFRFDFKSNASASFPGATKLLFGFNFNGGANTNVSTLAIAATDSVRFIQANNGSNPSLSLNNNFTQFSLDTWYRMTVTTLGFGTISNSKTDPLNTLTGLLAAVELQVWDSINDVAVDVPVFNPNNNDANNIFMLWPSSGGFSAVNSIDSAYLYAGYTNNTGLVDFNIDNVFVGVIPESATMSMIVLGSVLMIARSHRRQR